MKKEKVVCCFCGESMLEIDAVQIVVYPVKGSEEAQTLFSHRHHLVEKIHADIPLHPDLYTE